LDKIGGLDTDLAFAPALGGSYFGAYGTYLVDELEAIACECRCG